MQMLFAKNFKGFACYHKLIFYLKYIFAIFHLKYNTYKVLFYLDDISGFTKQAHESSVEYEYHFMHFPPRNCDSMHVSLQSGISEQGPIGISLLLSLAST